VRDRGFGVASLYQRWYTFRRNQGKGYEMKKSEAIDEQLHTMTCDMLSMVKNMYMPKTGAKFTTEEQAEACVAFAQEIQKVSNMCQDIAWTAHKLRDAIVEESWNAVLDEMADEMGVK